MTIDDYIANNEPFYHITAVEKKDLILENGLLNLGQKLGICVVRSGDDRIINHIASTQLIADLPSERYCVFTLCPNKHNIVVDEIKADTTIYEETNVLHNYILKQRIDVDEDDIYIDERIIYNDDVSKLLKQLNNENLLTKLEY